MKGKKGRVGSAEDTADVFIQLRTHTVRAMGEVIERNVRQDGVFMSAYRRLSSS